MQTDQFKTVNLEYFASIASKTQKSSESLTTNSKTIAELWQELEKKYELKVDNTTLRAAKNHHFCNWESKINDNDTIVFIPPVSGG